MKVFARKCEGCGREFLADRYYAGNCADCPERLSFPLKSSPPVSTPEVPLTSSSYDGIV